jgi:hypothetical protein
MMMANDPFRTFQYTATKDLDHAGGEYEGLEGWYPWLSWL